MSQITEERTDRLFHALADRTRRDILRRVLSEGQSISALAANYNMSFAAVQKHVAVLERSGLLIKQRRGREQHARGDVQAVRSVAALLDEFEQVWRDRIDRIDTDDASIHPLRSRMRAVGMGSPSASPVIARTGPSARRAASITSMTMKGSTWPRRDCFIPASCLPGVLLVFGGYHNLGGRGQAGGGGQARVKDGPRRLATAPRPRQALRQHGKDPR